jgi:hypothetical protein
MQKVSSVLERAPEELLQRGHLQFRFLLRRFTLLGLKVLVNDR